METPAIFDSLASLTVVVADTLYTTTWAAINDVKPFPVLSTLHVDGGYPFDDNLLFRGNGGTLRSLHLPFSAIARNALCRFDILKRSGVTRMNSIHIGMATDVDKAYLAGRTDLPIEEQVHRMLEVVTALKTNCDMTEVSVYQAILAAPSTAILQHINLCRFGFEMVDVISLISALPSLASVTYTIVGLGASIESIPANDCPSTLYAKHYPLRRNFRKLCVLYAENVSADKVAGVAMLIAIMCPNFVHVDIPPMLRKDFSHEIAWSTYCRSFKPFAASISRLIYSD
ncbi:hypothetical protein GGH94_005330 [Coemansia aciculifera]|uniref:Uncharacterized protein n=1 Tax=Coemansia aciculifera TaxID=417176 RepID=A0A9W8IK87_9FUNG|nr:hypothetical protein GGH94_005330 [Coemansia aciculifera]KAJ2870905.1 hypothetical protein GGH93_005230 [Coemansia aciculifera]